MAVEKTYEAPYTIISLFTLIVNEKPITINFTPVSIYMGKKTGRGSMYKTGDKDVQEALEKHSYFGSKYFLVGEKQIEEEKSEVKKEAEQNAGNEKEMKHIKVSTPAEAREYLVDTFGYAAKGLTRVERIAKAAEEHGIIFDYE